MSSPPDRFPDDDLPEGALIDCASIKRPVDDAFDFVIIGSGAAGAVAAHTLTLAGYSVALAEEGPFIPTRSLTDDLFTTFRRFFRDAAMQAMEGKMFIPYIQGRCVGGSTLINSAIAWRTPEDVIDDWRDRFGLGSSITMSALEPHFAALEEDLNVHAVADEVLGGNNSKFLEQARKHGLHPTAIKRYERHCKGSAKCMNGCPTGAKQSMNVTYIPWALRRGARLYYNCRVHRVELAGGRAVGTLGSGASGTTVRLRARRGVFVAASTVQSPNILRRSGIRSDHLGHHFQTHPGCGMGALLQDEVNPYFGATQGAESIHLRVSDRIKFETISINPELLPVRSPGLGHSLVRRMTQAKNLVIWVMLVRSQAEGLVKQALLGGRDQVRFNLTESDMHHVRFGLSHIAQMMFDAGAKEIWTGIYGLPSILTSPDQVKLVADGPLDPRAYTFVTSHMFGAARMGSDPRASVVGLDFAVHDVPNLYVIDSSVFPTNLGVNPQHSIMALARLAASRVADTPPLIALD